MKLSTGKVAFPIEFDNGDKQSIYFNPNDPDLMPRMKKMQENINNRINAMKDVELDGEGNPKSEDGIKEYEHLKTILFEEIDVAFGGDVSSVVFKHCSPFAIVDGEYFIFQFINAIVPEIKKHVEKANKKMAKHLEKYRK